MKNFIDFHLLSYLKITQTFKNILQLVRKITLII